MFTWQEAKAALEDSISPRLNFWLSAPPSPAGHPTVLAADDESHRSADDECHRSADDESHRSTDDACHRSARHLHQHRRNNITRRIECESKATQSVFCLYFKFNLDLI